MGVSNSTATFSTDRQLTLRKPQHHKMARQETHGDRKHAITLHRKLPPQGKKKKKQGVGNSEGAVCFMNMRELFSVWEEPEVTCLHDSNRLGVWLTDSGGNIMLQGSAGIIMWENVASRRG